MPPAATLRPSCVRRRETRSTLSAKWCRERCSALPSGSKRGDAKALADAGRLRTAVVESLEADPLVRAALARLRAQLEQDLDDPHGALAALIDSWLRSAAIDRLDDPERRAAFDQWVRRTADELLRRYHHEIGRTVREHLDRKSTRLNSSHQIISYAVFCL